MRGAASLICLASVACSSGGASSDGAVGPRGARPNFVEATSAAGVGYRQWDSAASWECDFDDSSGCPAAVMTGGVAAGDFDGDGRVDVYATRFDAPGLLYRNLGGGRFEDVTASAGLIAPERFANAAAWADVDGDGALDLVVGMVGGRRLWLWMNRGDGTFEEQAAARGVALEDGLEHFVFGLAFGDYDGDGWPDLYVSEWRPPSDSGAPPSHSRLMRNVAGHFEDVTDLAGLESIGAGAWAFSGRFADFDGDGLLDLAITADFGASRLLFNAGGGRFMDGTLAAGVGGDENGMGSAIADFDGDGRLDWFITSIFDDHTGCRDCGWGKTGNRLYRNLGDRRFEDVTTTAGVRDSGWGWGAVAFDYDNDGDVDLATVAGVRAGEGVTAFTAQPAQLFENDGRGHFRDVARERGFDFRGEGKGLMAFDPDGDGDLDLWLVDNAGAGHFFENGGGSGHWLELVGDGALGGRVELDRDGARARVHPLGDFGFLGQGAPAAHLGLGSATLVQQLRITWPDGRERILRNVPADQRISLGTP